MVEPAAGGPLALVQNGDLITLDVAARRIDLVLADTAGRLHTKTNLMDELAKLELDPEVWITHLKPGEIELTMQEIEELAGNVRAQPLNNDQLFEF